MSEKVESVKMCSECPNYQLCNELCPEAELYVKQDEVALHDLNIGLADIPGPSIRSVWQQLASHTYLTKMEKKIVTLLGQGLTRSEVCEVLEISRDSLRKHIQRLRNKAME